jgi:hypothetical protein
MVIEPNLEAPALHGLKKLEQALKNKSHPVTFSPDVGLMYAALDAADRISWTDSGQDPFEHIHDP